MKIVFFGAGAIGGYFGSVLHDHGHDVSVVARGETLEIIREQGLALELADGSSRRVKFPVAATCAQAAELIGGADVAVISTKSLPGNDTFGDVDSLDGVPLVTTHNSVEVHHSAAQLFGADRVLAGVMRTYAVKRGPADIVVRTGPMGFNFGIMPNAPEGEQLQRTRAVAQELEAALQGAGFKAKYYNGVDADILSDVWAKAMYVTTTGVLGALSRQDLGFMRTRLREQLVGLMEEVAAVAAAAGVSLPADAVQTTMGYADNMPAGSTSSLHRDIVDGLPNELDSQSGAIRRMARSVGVATPLFDLVHGCLEGVIARNPGA